MRFKKRKGYAMLVNLLIVVMVMGTISSSLAMQQSAYFTGLESGRTALQAQQLAATKANEVSVYSYSDATKTAEKRAAITGTDFEREVLVGPEVDLGSNNKKRDITVNVYKPGEAQARFSLPVTLTSQGSSNGVPVGTIIWYAASTPPTGWLVCNGQSTASYPALAAVIGSNVPDLRGEFIRGVDLGRGVDSGRLFGSGQSSMVQKHKHVSSWGENWAGPFGETIQTNHHGDDDSAGNNKMWHTNDGSDFDGIVNPSGVIGNETRPRNIALLPCIKY